MVSALTARGVCKSFDANLALSEVDLDVAPGSIHALLGGNGSGKSTLIKVLAGVHAADRGSIGVHGDTLDARRANPGWAARVGLRFVHQDLGLFPDLSVAENLLAGQDYDRRRGHIDWPSVRKRAARLLEQFEIPAHQDQQLGELSQAERTLVAIARALQADGGAPSDSVLVLDEPTSCLPNDEVDRLLTALKRYANDGHTIVMVSHRLGDVVGVADAATVLRDGRNAATLIGSEITEERIIKLITGDTSVSLGVDLPHVVSAPRTETEPLLEVIGLPTGTASAVNLTCRPGEIVGIAGMLGSGRSKLLRSIFGAQERPAGTVRIAGEKLEPGSINAAIAAGVSYVPENRAADAAFIDHSIESNMSIVGIGSYWRGLRLRRRREVIDARRDVERFLIAAQDGAQLLGELSGGNQQKVILARWLRSGPRVILLDEPTQGVDVRARAEIHALINGAVANGATALVVSSDFAELADLCDRVLVLRAGKIAADLSRSDLSEHALTSLAARVDATAATN